MLRLRFTATTIEWRGPSPFFFAPVPAEQAEEVRHAAKVASYGWGVIPVRAKVGGVAFTTSLFPKDGTYLVPLKDAVRRQAAVTAGDLIDVEIVIAAAR
jgi:hypothetical protein